MQQRYDMFMERKASVEAQMEEPKKTMQLIEHKCWYYETALGADFSRAVTRMESRTWGTVLLPHSLPE